MKGESGKEVLVDLAPGAEDNAFAAMLADLVRQNLESKPHKKADFFALAEDPGCTVALVADDAEVALTLEFRRGKLVLHDGIRGVPDVAVRGTSDAIMALSNVPLTRPLGLPVPTDRAGFDVMKEMVRATRTGELHVYGMVRHFRRLSRLTRLMSVNG